MRTLLTLTVVALSSFSSAAEERICRYCADAAAQLPLGLDLEGRYHYAPDRQVDVLHIKLDVVPDFKQRSVSGTTTIKAAPISKPVTLVRLDATDIHVRDVRCEQADVVDFVSTRNDLTILLGKPIPVGSPFTLEIDHYAEPQAGLYFRTPEMGYPDSDTHIWTQGETHESRHWYPCFDYPNERSSTEVVCHVPKGMTVLSNGVKMSEGTDDAGLTVVRWLHEKPHANYLICLVAGHLQALKKQHRDVPLGFYTQPTLAEHAKNSFRDTPSIMAYFEEEIGIPFPWPKYDQVTIRDFTAGGMENTTLTTLTHNTIFSEATENIRSTRGLDAHEMAHQWFGDYVTCKDWSHLWLNEGFATYYTHLYEGHHSGHDAMLYGLYRDATGRILSQKNDKRPIVFNGYKNPMEQFDYRSYPKGSWVLHMLRCQLGSDLYRKCIKAYLEKHALSSVVSDDLRRVIEAHSGRSMDRFFDQWVYHPRHPDLKIAYRWMPEQKLAKVTIQQTQKVDDDVLLFHLPTKLRFHVGDATVDHDITITSTREDFYVPLTAQPSLVRFDPEYTLLAEVSFDKPNGMLKTQLENDDDMIGRLLACRSLSDRKGSESVKMLEAALDDSFYGVRIAAAKALAKHDSAEAWAVLQNHWKQDDARVRLAIVELIAGRYTAETPALIANVLDQESNPAIQSAAIKNLGRFHSKAIRRQLEKYLQSTSFRNELASAAVSAIRLQNDPSYAVPLLTVLKENETQFTSNGFGRALETLAHVSRTQRKKNDVREFLLSHVDHPKLSVRTRAISALGTLGDTKAIPVLESLSRAGNTRVARAAEQALPRLRDAKPTAPREVIQLRSELAEIKKDNEKLRGELNELRDQFKATQ